MSDGTAGFGWPDDDRVDRGTSPTQPGTTTYADDLPWGGSSWDPHPPPPPPGSPGWTPYAPPPQPGHGLRPNTMVAVLLAALVGGVVGTGATLLATDEVSNGLRDDNASLGTGVVSPPEAREGAVAEVARKVLASVVSIDVAAPGGSGTGSGVIIRSDGYIVTNNHVVENAATVRVTLADGAHADADIVGTDPDTDLAVVKTRGRNNLPPATLGRSNNLIVGQPVVAIGSPLGLQGTVTSGIISALNRRVDVPGGGTGSSVLLANAIQTDAAINPGNSGGALVDMAGAVIGINSAIASLGGGLGGQGGSIGVGFAIPVDEARSVAEQIIRTGRATHPYVGVSGSDITPEVAEQFGLSVSEGALIQQVGAGTPAERAGLRAGDVIVQIADRKIQTFGDLVAAIRQHDIGDAVTIRYVRDGSERSARVVLAEKPAG